MSLDPSQLSPPWEAHRVAPSALIVALTCIATLATSNAFCDALFPHAVTALSLVKGTNGFLSHLD